MAEVVKYAKPFPQVTDRAEHATRCCKAERDGWLCTRIGDHDGQHEAGGPGGQLFASWPAEGGAPC